MTKRNDNGDVDFWALARSYLLYELPKVRKASPRTVESYRYSLECYLRFLKERHNIVGPQVSFDCFDRPHIKEFMEWMSQSGYAEKTRSLRLTAIRTFLNYAAYEDIVLATFSEQAKTVRGPRVPKRRIEHLVQEETAAILSASETHTAKGRRNKMVLILLYDTGARVSELAGIRLCDLRMKAPAVVTLHGKGGKARPVPLMDKTALHLGAYLSEFHPDFPEAAPEEPLFYSNRDGGHKPLSSDSISVILKKNAQVARAECPSMPDKIHCHLIRKTRAMDLYQAGIPLPLIMQLLGHESMSTTSSFYAFATLDMVADAIERSNSLAAAEPPCWKEKGMLDAIYSLR